MMNRLKILLLEDDMDDVDIIRWTLLENLPEMELDYAASGKTFRERLLSFQPDCVLADNSITGMNAAQALLTTRELSPHAAFVMVTGAVPEAYAIDMLQAGADDYILKDRLQRLPAAIEGAVYKHRAAAAEKLAMQKAIDDEERYRELVERITDAFIALDRNFCYTYLNPQAGKLINQDPALLIGRCVWDVFPQAVESETYRSFTKAMEEQVYVCSTDYYAPLDLWQENHIYPSPGGLSVFIRDISERKRAEQRQEFDRNNLSALINNTKDMLWSVDTSLRLITSNDAFNELVLGISGKPLKPGDSVVSDQFPENLRAIYIPHYNRALAGESFTIIDRFEQPTELWSEISFYPIRRDNHVIGIACYARDITELRKSVRMLQAMEKEMMHQKIQEQKKISRAIINAQEQERNRIGQELHDNVNQILAATKIFLQRAAKTDAGAEAIRYPLELIDNTIEEIRSLSSKQVTPLKNIHLKEMLQSLIDKMRQNSRTQIHFTFEAEEENFEDDLKLNVYRIIQEHINNVIKHAAAGYATVSVKKENDHIVLSLIDDGKGFDITLKRKGIGISNMINRVESFNGKMFLDSDPGKGCRLSVVLPY